MISRCHLVVVDKADFKNKNHRYTKIDVQLGDSGHWANDRQKMKARDTSMQKNLDKVVQFLPWALGLIGLLSITISVFYDTAPYGTHNIGEIQTQTLWMMFGGIFTIVSTIIFCTKNIKNETK